MGCVSSKEDDVDKVRVQTSVKNTGGATSLDFAAAPDPPKFSVSGLEPDADDTKLDASANLADSSEPGSARDAISGPGTRPGCSAPGSRHFSPKVAAVNDGVSTSSSGRILANGGVGVEGVVLEGMQSAGTSSGRACLQSTRSESLDSADAEGSSFSETLRPRSKAPRVSRSSYRSLPLPDELQRGMAGFTHPGIGRAGVNQDAYTVHVFRDAEGNCVLLSGVFDGHGPDGEKCAHTCAERLLQIFEQQSSSQLQTMGTVSGSNLGSGGFHRHVNMPARIGGSAMHHHITGQMYQRTASSGSFDNLPRGARSADHRIFRDAEERVLNMTFLAMEEEVQEECNAFLSGTTCSTCLVKKGAVWLAAVGDSTSVLVSAGEGGAAAAAVVSPDHRLTNEEELKRVIAAGARVAKRPNQKAKGHLRIWLQEADSPGLMVTRSIGDTVGKSIGVICEPDVFRVPITGRDKFIVMASDGVWDVVSPEEAAAVVMGATSPEDGAQELVNLSLRAWGEKRDAFKERYGRTPSGIGDNITAVVVSLAAWSAAEES